MHKHKTVILFIIHNAFDKNRGDVDIYSLLCYNMGERRTKDIYGKGKNIGEYKSKKVFYHFSDYERSK